MALPEGITTVTVSGTFPDLNGTPPIAGSKISVAVHGDVWLEVISGDAEGAEIPPIAEVVEVDTETGEWSIALPVNDDEDVQPNGFTYDYTATLIYLVDGQQVTKTRTKAFELTTADGPTAKLTSLVSVMPATPVIGVVTTVNGVGPDSQGHVSIPVGAVTSVNGQTGAVTVEVNGEALFPTGLPDDAELTTYASGNYVITAPGTYELLDVDSIEVRCDDVLIRNCRVRGGTDWSVYFRPGWDTDVWNRRRVIEHCDLEGSPVRGAGFTMRYCDLADMAADGVEVFRSDEPTIIERNTFRDFMPGEDGHVDGIQVQAKPRGPVVIRDNDLDVAIPGDYTLPSGAGVNSAIYVNYTAADNPDDPDPDLTGSITIEGNTLEAPLAAYVLRVVDEPVHLNNNKIGPGTAAPVLFTVPVLGGGNRLVDAAGGDLGQPMTDPQLLGDAAVASAGSSGGISAEDAAESYAVGGYPLAGYGLVSASVPPESATASSTLDAGTAVFARQWVPAGTVISGGAAFVRSAGDTASTGIQGFAVFEDDGTLAGSSTSDDTLFATGGWRHADFDTTVAAQSSGRWVYAAYVSNLTTAPQFAGAADAKALLGGVDTANRRCFYQASVTEWATMDSSSYGTTSTQVDMICLY